MILNSLHLENYKQYRRLELVFREGLVGIVGKNGAGKSTIFEAILYCLFGRDEWGVGDLLRKEPFDSRALQALLCMGTLAKHAAHGIDSPDFQPPERAMYQIGG